MPFMKMNDNGLQLIRTFEGLRLDAYYCPAGYLTIGYGHLVQAGEPKKINRIQAEAYLAADIAKFEPAVLSMITVPSNENQISALICFAFNVGAYALKQSSLLRLHNEKKFKEAAAQFDLWCKATINGVKKPLDGLIRRRDAEEALYKGDIVTLYSLLNAQG
jgi:lysozyme